MARFKLGIEASDTLLNFSVSKFMFTLLILYIQTSPRQYLLLDSVEL